MIYNNKTANSHSDLLEHYHYSFMYWHLALNFGYSDGQYINIIHSERERSGVCFPGYDITINT